ncbi:MAG: hypothetical protein JWM10_5278 [Myxococcaceae bacterium]|nr:hypothetical protein [Myxococcaceae bacterium]
MNLPTRAMRVFLWTVYFHAAACARRGPAVDHGGAARPARGEINATRAADAAGAPRHDDVAARYGCGQSLPAAYAFYPSENQEYLTDRVVLTPPLGFRLERASPDHHVTCETELSDSPWGNIYHIGDIRHALTRPGFLALLVPDDVSYGESRPGAAAPFILEHARGRIIIGRPCAPSANGCRSIPAVLDGVREVLEHVYRHHQQLCTLTRTAPP